MASHQRRGVGIKDELTIMQLPADFIALMREHLGDAQAEALFEGLRQPPTVSVRFNPLKTAHLTLNREALGDPVPWCPDAYYLSEHKAFTFDPLFHAGAYYVQDASSMYLSEVLRKFLPQEDGQGRYTEKSSVKSSRKRQIRAFTN